MALPILRRLPPHNHFNHIITQRRIESLRYLIRRRELHPELEFGTIGGGAIDIGIGRNTEPQIGTAVGFYDQSPALFLKPRDDARYFLLDDLRNLRSLALQFAVKGF